MTTHHSVSQQELPQQDLSELATFAGGCFWCTEGAFRLLQGVYRVQSGYTGGHTEQPTYEEVCTGKTGHAEAIRVEYNPSLISYLELVQIFFAVHDPRQLNRQGNDIGSQYRTAIFTHSNEQAQIAQSVLDEIKTEVYPGEPVYTQIEPLGPWYPAEDHHENYFERNPENPYCQAVVAPKLLKFRQVFSQKLKD